MNNYCQTNMLACVGHPCVTADVQAIGDVRETRRLGHDGEGVRLGPPPRVRRHDMATIPAQGRVPPG